MAHSDVIVVVLSAAAGLTGLVLVFLGIIVTTYQSFDGDTPASVLNRYRWLAGLVLGPFTLGIACVALSTVWLLLSKNNQDVYLAALAAFGAHLLTLLTAAGVVTWRVMWH